MDKFIIERGEKSKEHRDQLIRDMIYVGCLPQFSDKNRREFVNVSISWSFSDRSKENINRSAKYRGCPYWSKNALYILDSKGKVDTGELRHEHIIPRKIFVDAVLSRFKRVRIKIENGKDIETLLNEEFEYLKEKMSELLKGCVVTKTEAEILDSDRNKSEMPEHAYAKNNKPQNDEDKFFEIKDPWARYRNKDKKFRIDVFELEWSFENSRWKENKNKRKKLD